MFYPDIECSDFDEIEDDVDRYISQTDFSFVKENGSIDQLELENLMHEISLIKRNALGNAKWMLSELNETSSDLSYELVFLGEAGYQSRRAALIGLIDDHKKQMIRFRWLDCLHDHLIKHLPEER